MPQLQEQTIRCLICNRMEPRRSLIGHISEHIGLKPHVCEYCDFQTAFESEAMDHEADNLGHHVNINAIPYHSRICRFIYNDCDFADRNNCNLEQVLDRPLGNNRATTTPSVSNGNGAVDVSTRGSKQTLLPCCISTVNSTTTNELAISTESSRQIEPISQPQQLSAPSSPIPLLLITDMVRSHSRTNAITLDQSAQKAQITENNANPNHPLMPVQAENIATRVYIDVAEQQRQKSQQGHQKKRGRPCKLLGVIHQQRRKELVKSDAARRKAYVLRSQIKSMIR